MDGRVDTGGVLNERQDLRYMAEIEGDILLTLISHTPCILTHLLFSYSCTSKIRVPLSKDRQGPGELYFRGFYGLS